MQTKFLKKGLWSPLKVDIEVTSKCNLRCDYCYFFSGGGDVSNELTTEEWLRLRIRSNRYSSRRQHSTM